MSASESKISRLSIEECCEVEAFFEKYGITYAVEESIEKDKHVIYRCVKCPYCGDDMRVCVFLGDNGNSIATVCENTSCKGCMGSWEDFKAEHCKHFPSFMSVQDAMQKPPKLAKELIQGIIRKKRVMLLSAPSKAGKTMLLINLAVCIAEGLRWLDSFQCEQGKVLYINLEIDESEMVDRFQKVYAALGYDPKQASNNISLWNLRGTEVNQGKLLEELGQRMTMGCFDAIIIDPFYSLMQGDENSAKDVSAFCRGILKLSEVMDTTVIYCHHHSKAGGSYTNGMNRASGSGVFARNADALIDMVEIAPSDVGKSLEQGQRAYRISGTIRSFASFPDFEVVYDYPLHKKVDGLKECEPVSGSCSPSTNGKRGNMKKRAEIQKKKELIIRTMKKSELQQMPVKEAAELFDVAPKTIQNWFKEDDMGCEVVKGLIMFKPLPTAEEFDQEEISVFE